jgi:hypothetical protein
VVSPDKTLNSRDHKKVSGGLSLRQFFISLLIVSYFAIAVIQVSPGEAVASSALTASPDPLVQMTRPLVVLFGLKQRWNLFAPDIRRMNQYSTSIITFEDGSQKLYEWPRINLLPVEQRFFKHRVMRFITEAWAQPQYRNYLPFGAKFLSMANSNSDNPPAMVELYFNYCDIPPFSKYCKRDQLPKNFRWSAPEFAYRVRSE